MPRCFDWTSWTAIGFYFGRKKPTKIFRCFCRPRDRCSQKIRARQQNISLLEWGQHSEVSDQSLSGFCLAPVFKAAKLTGNPHPHQFRHTFASKLLSHGTSVENVAALLGNTPTIVWKQYAAFVKERQEALDQAVLIANGFHHLKSSARPTGRKSARA